MVMEAEQSAEDDTFQLDGQKVLTHTNEKKRKEKKNLQVSNSKTLAFWD